MHEVDMTKCLLLSLQEWKRGQEPQHPGGGGGASAGG